MHKNPFIEDLSSPSDMQIWSMCLSGLFILDLPCPWTSIIAQTSDLSLVIRE